MKRLHLHFTPTNVIAYVLFFLSACILSGVIVFTAHVDVLKNWYLTLPDQQIHAGDPITVTSVYTKVRPVTGTARRYVECKNKSQVFIRYPLNEATADRAPGRAGTGLSLKIPDTIPDLPTTCRISVVVTYKVYPWRTVTEYAQTKDFTLLPTVLRQGSTIRSLHQGVASYPNQARGLRVYSSVYTTPIPDLKVSNKLQGNI